MKLLNQIIKTAGSAEGSKQIFQEIFESGFERCLVVEPPIRYSPTARELES
jgi:hypothetical protein